MRQASLTRELFGGQVEIVLFDVEERLAADLLEEAYRRGLQLQKIFNFFDSSSALSSLNERRKSRVPPELSGVLSRALQLCGETNGAYDVSLGKNFVERKKGLALTPLRCSYKDIKVQGDTVELTHPDALIDLGSVAKGYIADQMAGFLMAQGVVSGLVDARGDIRVFGERGQPLEIQHPRQRDAALAAIKLADGGVATSGDYNQFTGDFGQCHILNKKGFISVTVVAPTLMEADLYATALFVSTKEQAKGLLAGKASSIKALCVDESLGVFKYNGMEELLVEADAR